MAQNGSNYHDHASIKTVIKLRGWEEQGTESAKKMYSADVTGGGPGRSASTKIFTSFGWKAMAGEVGWGSKCCPSPPKSGVWATWRVC